MHFKSVWMERMLVESKNNRSEAQREREREIERDPFTLGIDI